jgi:hypothetical protein
VAGARVVVVGVPALGVRQRQPAEEARQLPGFFGPQDEVPVVRHQAVGQQAGGGAGLGLLPDALEGPVVLVLEEQGAAAVAAVEGVVDEARLSDPQ